MNKITKNEVSILPFICILYYNVAGGFDFIIIEALTNTVSEITVIFLRFLVASIVLSIIICIRRSWPKMTKGEFLRVAICAAFGFSIYYTMEAIGIHRTSGALASLLLSFVPIFGLAGERIVYKTKLSRQKGIFAICTIIGVVMIVMGASNAEF